MQVKNLHKYSCGRQTTLLRNSGFRIRTRMEPIVYEKNGSDAQKWIVQQIPDPTGYYDPEFVRPAELIPVINKNLRLDCVDGGNVNGTGIQVHAANNTSAQHWAVVDTGVGSWVLINVVSSKALDVKNGG